MRVFGEGHAKIGGDGGDEALGSLGQGGWNEGDGYGEQETDRKQHCEEVAGENDVRIRSRSGKDIIGAVKLEDRKMEQTFILV